MCQFSFRCINEFLSSVLRERGQCCHHSGLFFLAHGEGGDIVAVFAILEGWLSPVEGTRLESKIRAFHCFAELFTVWLKYCSPMACL